jgi:hypothetical protein
MVEYFNQNHRTASKKLPKTASRLTSRMIRDVKSACEGLAIHPLWIAIPPLALGIRNWSRSCWRYVPGRKYHCVRRHTDVGFSTASGF